MVIKMGRRSAGRRSALAATAALIIGVGTWAGPAQADPSDPGGGSVEVAAPVDCPSPMPVADITAGMIGEGWTVVRGGTPQPFQVQVLGVLTDGIGAGRDLVMIEISDLPGGHVVDAGRGYGRECPGRRCMSAANCWVPCRTGYQLPSPIGGLTPAADMFRLLGSTASVSSKAEALSAKSKVTLTANERRLVKGRAKAAVPGKVLERLRTPMSVSGLSSKRLTGLQQEFDAAGRSVITYAGGRASAGSSGPQPDPRSAGILPPSKPTAI